MKQVRGQKVFLSDAVLSSLINTNYGLNVHSIDRILSIPKVSTNRGIFGFKNANELIDLPFVYQCIKWIRLNGFPFIPSVLPCKNGQVYFEHDNELYYMEEWVKGEDILFADLPLIEQIGSTLARFHQASEGIVPPKNSPRMEYGQRLEKLHRIHQDVQRWKSRYEPVPEWIMEPWMLDVLEMRCRLSSSYIRDVQNDVGGVKGVLSHGSLHQRNILLNAEGEIHLIDVESLLFAERTYDLASFIHYFAPSHNWNPSVIHRFIKGYHEASREPLSYSEWRCLFSFLAFPRRMESWCYRHFDHPTEFSYFKLLGILVHDQQKEDLFKQYYPSLLEPSLQLFEEMTKGGGR
ncbi:spore coat protein, CotS family [Fictibacillus solisalsi]|uniref:Spore coat protein, CotS family n=1 Tax=Fictibacillus solisalsi TaxID=459525 RepID=A0A1H0ABA6_9BACL|nr:phosphotransferase [Fictibacillus solisalsi]SDN30840.1 spore coat protein, CotS family [Fictibacillus solisalsi]